MFAPLDARSNLLPEELAYASAASAAMRRKPARAARMLSISVVAFFLFMVIWAAVAEVDEVTHAEGQVVASQRIQVIQNLEGGILNELLVNEGQIVEVGDVLARLDNEVAASSYRDAISRALDHHAAILRLEAELVRHKPVFPDDASALLTEVLGGVPVSADIAEQALQVFRDHEASWKARTQQKEAELALMRSQYEQRLQEVAEQQARRRQLEGSLAIAEEKLAIATPLLDRGNYSRTEYLNLQSQKVQFRGELDTMLAAQPRTRAAVAEAEQRMAFREAELASAITDEINKRRLDLASLRETLSAGGDRVTRTELRAPVHGIIRQIYISSVGGVVKPGESVMDIVPLDGTLLVEARVRPSDVAFLRPGQDAMVKITAYDFAIYGGLPGKLEQISADAFEDRRGESFFQVRVRTDATALVYRGKELPIMPGMMATVDIMIGKKTVLDYLLKPVLRARQDALREK